ncbi:NAD(P)-dependent oxidoreductase [Isoptericola sp. b441]|uniref:NAD(P)-dependent oxidoreductase n=1 Tax=Actinotalea lenta TaxID=3064654 RepID=A0ABT9D6L3_9CELL|nr:MULTISPECIES: NAD(P)-dependent oxidoreductase [unclassified Isoptericola]MDO8106456.1 NAD(P)-dependent oxidoreductase [Isoptericola sp. b441]MDO8121828.1 NAD(P)-dependent oxidoreductase [Isoptericola sp. b490]
METITVTGAFGKAGRAVVGDLLEHGYRVVATDLAGPPGHEALGTLGTELVVADLTDYGAAVEVLAGSDAVVHLGNIPAPGRAPAPDTLAVNTAVNGNVFLAAARVGLRKVVWASSETTLGLPFDVPPRYAPVDEAHFPVPTSTYALSKVLGEQTAHHVSQWSGIPFVGLRLSNIHRPQDYAAVPGYQDDARLRRWNLWGYVDVRDVAQAARLGLEQETTGSQNVIIAAADTIMARPSAELMAEVFPGVPLTKELVGNETLLAIDGARALLGYAPEHSWRDEAG